MRAPLSGNGRHRRPHQAPALLVAAGVGGASIALPLLGASGAHAASNTTWDRVAECESGGVWSETGKQIGFYGGLQMSMDTWKKYGGLDYAPRPDLASRLEQIAVAEKVLKAEGAKAFQECAIDAGLHDEPAGDGKDAGKGSSSKHRSGGSKHKGGSTPAPTGRTHTVAAGETLAAIAAAEQVPGGAHALYEKNRAVIGANPDHIYPGLVLALP